LGLPSGAIDHFDRAGDQDFAGGAGLEECVAGAEGNPCLVRPSRLRADSARQIGTPSAVRRQGGCATTIAIFTIRPGLSGFRRLGVPSDGRGRWLVRSKRL
jgi:hypothetical protein